jgi:response regulator RpfG family c-di-GMP phosphodiesterase
MQQIDFTQVVTADLRAQAALAAERSGMVCSPMQGKLALGEALWGAVLVYRDTATLAERQVIDSASEWRRVSQNIAFFAYLLGLDDAAVDDLFRAARMISL